MEKERHFQGTTKYTSNNLALPSVLVEWAHRDLVAKCWHLNSHNNESFFKHKAQTLLFWFPFVSIWGSRPKGSCCPGLQSWLIPKWFLNYLVCSFWYFLTCFLHLKPFLRFGLMNQKFKRAAITAFSVMTVCLSVMTTDPRKPYIYIWRIIIGP